MMATQFITGMNRTESGFHLLAILSLADGRSSEEEINVIHEFIENAFSGKIDLIRAQAFVKALPEEEMESHFAEVAARFYSISTQEDRNTVLNFAMKVVMADNEMKPEENRFINTLYDAWGLD